MKRPKILATLGVVFLAITLPYGLAALFAGREFVFIGFLINPLDGATYLAKMQEGWSGAWRFVLPYSSDPGSGTFLFLYYLFLGHIARWFSLSLILTYHLARLAGAALLLLALVQFYDLIFAGREDLYRLALWLTVLGSGMGWTIVLLGQLPSDFWVAEAYPFLAMFDNPHFPLGLALLVSTFSLLLQDQARWRNTRLMLNGLLISIIFPFALVIAVLVSVVWLGWMFWSTRRLDWKAVISLGLLGGPFLISQFGVTLTHPALAVWNAQNLTASPPLWDLILSFSPGLLLAPFGVYALAKLKQNTFAPLLFAWVGLSLALIYFPFSLQRRFMLGLYIPVAILAVFGLDFLRSRFTVFSRWLAPVALSLALPTNLLLILMGLLGAYSHTPMLYFRQDEAQALAWIKAETPPQSIILASPAMGAWIPAETGRRVIYGHPFETIHASLEKARVDAVYKTQGMINFNLDIFQNPGVDYLMYGPRERALGGNLDLSTLPLVFNSQTVRVYQIKRLP